MVEMEFVVDGKTLRAGVQNLVIAGWTGRDTQAVEEHIAELEAIGVARPRTVPCFYRVGNNLLSTQETLDVCGTESSGEVEFVLVSLDEGMFVGVGSDHTDRKAEAYDVTVSKQMCPKPVSRELWRFSEVEQHWDQLMLRSWVTRGGERTLYQEGSVTRMHSPAELIRRYLAAEALAGVSLASGTTMYCGTLALLAPIAASEEFEVQLEDPVLRRSLRHRYRVRSLTMND
jgi:hypothetical protein